MDQGAYFEFKRHRMMTQTPQALTTRLGYAIPKAMSQAGVEGLYRQAMNEAARLYEELWQFHPEAASYVVPNGYNRRVLCRLNLRELFHSRGCAPARTPIFPSEGLRSGWLNRRAARTPVLRKTELARWGDRGIFG